MGGPSPLDKSVPRPPRDVQPVRDSVCGPVVSGDRGQGRPGEVVVQHLSEPVVAGETDVDQCLIKAGDRTTVHLLVRTVAAMQPHLRGLVAVAMTPGVRRLGASSRLARRVAAAKPVVAVRNGRWTQGVPVTPVPYATTSTEAVRLDHDDPQPPDPGRRAPQGHHVKAVALVDCRPVRLAERRRGKVMQSLQPLHLIAQPAKWLPPVWTWARVSLWVGDHRPSLVLQPRP